MQHQLQITRSASEDADATIRRFSGDNADQEQECTKEEEETLWEMTREPHTSTLGLVSSIQARFSPCKRCS